MLDCVRCLRLRGDYKLHIIQALIHIKKLEVCLRASTHVEKINKIQLLQIFKGNTNVLKENVHCNKT
jgi:hypothetical protein